jgi:hypothetical protein
MSLCKLNYKSRSLASMQNRLVQLIMGFSITSYKFYMVNEKQIFFMHIAKAGGATIERHFKNITTLVIWSLDCTKNTTM